MEFKIDKNLVCDVCGKPVKHGDVEVKGKPRIGFTCSNPDCDYSKDVEIPENNIIPIWIVFYDRPDRSF